MCIRDRFEGNTGPYILYTIVRTKSLLAKVKAQNITVDENSTIEPADSKSETDVMLALTKWSETVNAAFEEHAPHKICLLYTSFPPYSLQLICV